MSALGRGHPLAIGHKRGRPVVIGALLAVSGVRVFVTTVRPAVESPMSQAVA